MLCKITLVRTAFFSCNEANYHNGQLSTSYTVALKMKVIAVCFLQQIHKL